MVPSVQSSAAHSVCRLFEGQAAKTPAAPALIRAGETISYGILDEETTDIARRLAAHGVSPGDVVGLVVDRSLNTIRLLLGILKSGGVYLPLDPCLPEARLQIYLNDCAPNLILSGSEMHQSLVGRGVTSLVRVSSASLPSTWPQVEPTGHDPAYVIYTSGSSGRPKGVINEHAGLALLAQSTGQQFAITGADRILQFANLAFDLSLWELFLCLANGAALVMADQEALYPGPMLHALLKEQCVTVALLSPSVLRVLPADNLPSLRLLVAGAERCPSDIVRRWKPGRRFFNAYGPTEASVCATVHEVEETDNGDPPIGRAVPGSQVTVIGGDGQQLTNEEAGELCIGGVSVARGYLNQPKLTAKVFASGPTGRRYLTGDRARQRGDGVVHFLGRLDSQVKIRGFRVEPQEVERVVAECPGVSTASVLSIEDDRGQWTLCAFYSPEADSAVNSGVIAVHVSQHLPAFMLPARYLRLTHWPLTPNAKLDLAALRQLAAARPSPVSTTVEDATCQECAAILELCRLVLCNPALSPEENLLLAGLNSLLAAEMLWAIKDRFGVVLSFRDIRLAKTVVKLNAIIKQRVTPDNVKRPTDIIRQSRSIPATRDWAVSAAQRRFYILHQASTTRLGYHIEASVRIDCPYDPRKLIGAIQAVVARHEALRTTFHETGGEIFQRIHPIGMIEIGEVSAWEAGDRLPDRVRRPFDLSQLPLMRAFVAKRDEDGFNLILDLAHVVSDATSVAIILGDINRAFKGTDLGAQPRSYREYTLWNNAQLGSREQRRVENHWRRVLEAPPPSPNWPRSLRGLPKGGAEVEHLLLEEVTSLALRRLASDFGATLFMLLSAIYGVCLGRLTGAQDVIVQSVFAGRPRPELQNIVGPLARSLPLRIRPAPAKAFLAFAAEVSDQVEAAFEHQDFDFEDPELAFVGGACRNLCRAGFTLQGMPNLFNDRIYAEDIPWPVDLNVEACELGSALDLRIICAGILSAPGASAIIAREFACVIENVLNNPKSSISDLTNIKKGSLLIGQEPKSIGGFDFDFG